MNTPKTPFTMNMEHMALSTVQIQFSISMEITARITLSIVLLINTPTKFHHSMIKKETFTDPFRLTNMLKE